MRVARPVRRAGRRNPSFERRQGAPARPYTYVRTWAGFLYLAVVLDVFSRKVVGWAMANHLRTELVLEALNMAIGQRRPQGVIHHSDRGSQYTSLAFGKRCREMAVVTSTGSAGECYDNAMAESFFATLECELLQRRTFHTHGQARMAIFAFLESWYNTRRLHSALGYLSPNEFERRAAPGGRPMGTEGHREPTTQEPFRIGQPGIHNHPLREPPTPVSESDFIPSAIVHPGAGGDSPQPSTESG